MKSQNVKQCVYIIALVAGLLPGTPSDAAVPDWMPGRRLLIAQKISSWNEKNKSLNSEKIEQSVLYAANGLAWATFDAVSLTGTITNNTHDAIAGIIVDYIIFNKTTKAEVIRARLAIRKTVYKTISIDFKYPFHADPLYPSTRGKKTLVTLGELRAASEQLGGDFAWYTKFVATIPYSIDSAYGLDAYASQAVDICLEEVPPSS